MTVDGGRVRFATTADLAALQAIEAAADGQFAPLMDVSGWGPPATGESRGAEPGFVLVVGEPVVGFAHVLDLDGHLHLEQLAVDPSHGRQGLGSALVEAVCRVATSRGADEVTLMTFADVPWNGPWYTARGFSELALPLPDFLQPLRATEDRLGLARQGRRIAMVRDL